MDPKRTMQVRAYVAANIRRLRERRGYTQEQLAERAGLDVRQLQRVERAAINTSVGVLVAIADALDVKPGMLFRRAEMPGVKVGRPRKGLPSK